MLDRLFALSARRTDAKTEVLAGITTFLTMAYILFVNPSILGAAGMDRNAVLLTTAIGAGALMMEAVRHIDFSDFSEGLPAFLTIALMPFAYSIANGISAGLVVYPRSSWSPGGAARCTGSCMSSPFSLSAAVFFSPSNRRLVT